MTLLNDLPDTSHQGNLVARSRRVAGAIRVGIGVIDQGFQRFRFSRSRNTARWRQPPIAWRVHAAVGAQMRTLERVCERQLFDCSGRSIRLNDAGRSFIGQARAVVAEYDSLPGGVAEELSVEGPITIGSTMSSMGFRAANVIRPRCRIPDWKYALRTA
ncbi:hypothetical protein PQQ78_43075 [Paraburkholderia sediminicola]